MSKLKIVDMSFMKLSEKLPTRLNKTNYPYLKYLGLTGTGLRGTMPSTIGTITNLRYIGLNKNSLSGTIPASLGQLTLLGCLTLERNMLMGTIPPEIGLLTALTILDMSKNRFSGNIPSSFSNLRALETYSLSENSLTGYYINIYIERVRVYTTSILFFNYLYLFRSLQAHTNYRTFSTNIKFIQQQPTRQSA